MVLISPVLRKSLLNQATHELASSLLYTEASHWFAVRHLEGLAKRFDSEAEEEKTHHNQILKYITLRGGEVQVSSPLLPQREWKNEKSVFEFFLNIEKDNYQRLHDLHKHAREEKDYCLESFLLDFLKHQVKSVDEWEKMFTMVSSFTAIPGLIWHLDQIVK